MPEGGRPELGPLLEGGTIDAFLAFWLEHPLLPEAEQRTLEGYYAGYRKHFGPYVRHWYRRQTQELMDLIRTLGHPRVLEVGCGCGTESLWAALAGAEVLGVDIDPALLAVAEARKGWVMEQVARPLACTFARCSVLDVPESRPFDLIYVEQAFHHLEPRAEVVAKLDRLLAPGGHLVFSESNAWNPLLQAMLFRLRGRRTIIHHMGHTWGNERITFPFALAGWFLERGYEREGLAYFRTLPNHPFADRFLAVDRRLPGWLKPLFTHYNLVLRKAGRTV